MSHPNNPRRKKTPRGSKAASRKSAAPGRKNKKANPASAAKPVRPAKLSKALLLRLAKQFAQQQAAPGGVAWAAAPQAKFPVPPQSPPQSSQPAAGNGAPPAHQQPSAEIRSDTPSAPPQSIIPRRSSNGGGYHTKYLIEIYGSLKADGSHLLIVDGKRIKIDWLQFILLLILASHARSKAGLDSPVDLRGGDYLQPARIEEIITQLKAGSLRCAGRQLPECHNAYGADLLRNAKYDLRLRVQRKHKNPNLLDSGEGAGYRISTPPARIKITLVIEGEHDLVFDWRE